MQLCMGRSPSELSTSMHRGSESEARGKHRTLTLLACLWRSDILMRTHVKSGSNDRAGIRGISSPSGNTVPPAPRLTRRIHQSMKKRVDGLTETHLCGKPEQRHVRPYLQVSRPDTRHGSASAVEPQLISPAGGQTAQCDQFRRRKRVRPLSAPEGPDLPAQLLIIETPPAVQIGGY